MFFALIGACFIGLSLGILGSGGAILTVPVLIFGLGFSEKIAIASALVIVGLISAISACKGIKHKHIHWPLVLKFGVPSVLGAYLGAWGSAYVEGLTQVIILALVMLLASWRMLQSNALELKPKTSTLAITFQGVSVGLLTGFVGVGGGFLIVPALVLLGGIAMSQAVYTSLVIISINSFSGFIKYYDFLAENNLTLDWSTIFIITTVGIIGSFIGQHYSSNLPQHKLKKGFALFLIVMAAFILFESLLKR